jgi:hypothetical protein
MALPSWLLVFVGGRRSQRLGPSPTPGSLGPYRQRHYKSRVSLQVPLVSMVFRALLMERCMAMTIPNEHPTTHPKGSTIEPTPKISLNWMTTTCFRGYVYAITCLRGSSGCMHLWIKEDKFSELKIYDTIGWQHGTSFLIFLSVSFLVFRFIVWVLSLFPCGFQVQCCLTSRDVHSFISLYCV